MQDKLSTKIPVKKLVFDIYKGSFLRTYYVRVDKYFNILKKSLITKKQTPKIKTYNNPVIQNYNLFKHNKEIFINSIESKVNLPKNAKIILKQIPSKYTLEKVSQQNLVNRMMHEIITFYLTNDKTFISDIKKNIEKLSNISYISGISFRKTSIIKKHDANNTSFVDDKLKKLKTLSLLNIDINSNEPGSYEDIEINTYKNAKRISDKYKSTKFKLIKKYDTYSNSLLNGYIQSSFVSEKNYITSGIYLSNILNYINLDGENIEVIIKKISGNSIEKNDVKLFSNTAFNLDFITKLNINTFNFLLKLQNPIISSDLINLNNEVLLNDINLKSFFYNLFLLFLIDNNLFQNLCDTYINNNFVYYDTLQDVLTFEKSIKNDDTIFNVLHKHIKEFLSINNECFFKGLCEIIEKEFTIRYDKFHEIIKNLINKNESFIRNYIILLYAIVKLKVDDFFDILLLSLNDILMEIDEKLESNTNDIIETFILLLSKVISIFSVLLAYKFNMIVNQNNENTDKYEPQEKANFKIVYSHIYNIINLIMGKLTSYINAEKQHKENFYNVLLKHIELFWNNTIILPHVLFFMDLLTYKVKKVLPVRYDKVGKLVGFPVVSYFFNNVFYKKLLNDINITNILNLEEKSDGNENIEVYIPVAYYNEENNNVSIKRVVGIEFAYTDISKLDEKIKEKYDFAKLKIDKSKIILNNEKGYTLIAL